jgi:hypothetical protein
MNLHAGIGVCTDVGMIELVERYATIENLIVGHSSSDDHLDRLVEVERNVSQAIETAPCHDRNDALAMLRYEIVRAGADQGNPRLLASLRKIAACLGA